MTSAPSSRRTSPPSSGSTAARAERFLKLVECYIDQAVAAGAAAGPPLDAFTQGLDKLVALAQSFVGMERNPDPLAETWAELTALRATLADDIAAFNAEVAARARDWAKTGARQRRPARRAPGAAAGRGTLPRPDEGDRSGRQAGRACDRYRCQGSRARESDDWPGAEITRARKALEIVRVPKRSRRCTSCVTS